MISKVLNTFSKSTKKEKNNFSHRNKLQKIINKSIVQEYEKHKLLTENKIINENEALSINIVADEVAKKSLDIAEKLKLECSCVIKNLYANNEVSACIEIDLVKQLSNFSFSKYADYIQSQIEVPIDSKQFIIDSKIDNEQNKINISIIKI